MANILETAPHDWKYVSEGGATIVFSYTRSAHSDFDGMVLRLRKISLKKSATEGPDNACGEEPDDPTIEYQTKCMQGLIPPEHLPRLQTVHLDRSWLEELSRLHNSTRPENRRAKDEIDLKRKKGVLATDLVGGNWLAVEIKPKWAFLPSPIHLSEETRSIKTQTCRFCMHSHLRARGSQEEITNYCPLDLFSGDKTRILKAIHDLWDAWVASNATVNNLKIFARGKFVTPSEAHVMLSENEAAGEEFSVIRDAFASALVEPLLRTPVLHILSDLQRDLDALDIEGLSRLWRLTESSAILNQTNPSQASESVPTSTPLGVTSRCIQAPDPTISDWIDFVHNYSSPDKPTLDHSNPSPDHLRYYILAYLLSATFKDCSVIVKLDFLQSCTTASNVTPNSVTVIDLDPKKVDKLKDWEKLDQEIVRTYASANKKTCIDAWKSPNTT
ncbi:inositol-pentakisphosphate 2-kinase [Pholiota conissans]|uniref:Inositol-pentakisphosphate 2-kinase n=1 Tax=Pholiota conissans TaxID=109636 RepID=A0A9P6D3U4_9AGAR|nr:inositol-pentakisphosphate 2-kinase [Pholiota conissans]